MHAYGRAGPVVVRLTVVNALGSSSSSEATVLVGSPPTPSYTVSQPSASALAVELTDTSTGAPEAVVWDFGDGHTLAVASAGATVRHVYARAGSYRVVLSATNGAGTATVDHPATTPPGSRVVVTATAVRIAKPGATVPAGRKVVVSWKVPDVRGARIDRYQVVCRATGSVRTLLVTANDSAASLGKVRSRTLTSLALGRRYTCTVRAHNAAGWNLASLATDGFVARA